jgi:hypothetical protein
MAQRPGQPVVKIAHVLKRIKTTGRALGSPGSNEVVAKLPAAFRREVRRRPQPFTCLRASTATKTRTPRRREGQRRNLRAYLGALKFRPPVQN